MPGSTQQSTRSAGDTNKDSMQAMSPNSPAYMESTYDLVFHRYVRDLQSNLPQPGNPQRPKSIHPVITLSPVEGEVSANKINQSNTTNALRPSNENERAGSPVRTSGRSSPLLEVPCTDINVACERPPF